MSVGQDYRQHSNTGDQTRKQLRHGLVLAVLVIVALLGGLWAYFGAEDPAPEPVTVADSPDEPEISQPEPQAEPLPPDEAEAQFDFYQELPRREVIITEADLRTDAAASKPARNRVRKPAAETKPVQRVMARPEKKATEEVAARASPVARRTAYLIQAGVFRDRAAAQRRQAQLASLDIRASVESKRVANGLVYRVQIGPLRIAGNVQAMRQRLAEHNIDSRSIKGK